MDLFFFITLIFASAFFSSSETAFLSFNKIRLKQIERMSSSSSRRVVNLLRDPHKLLITILVGNTLVNIAASAIIASLFFNWFGEKGVGLSILAMTILVLIFGEVTPKRFALSHSEKVAFFAAFPVKVLEFLFSPARFFLNKIVNSVIKGLGVKVKHDNSEVTEEEIRHLLHVSKKQGVVKRKEKDMIDNILEFKELNAADIMTPRINVTALDITEPNDIIAKKMKDGQYSRFPVYVHTLDNIVGILHSKEFLLEPGITVKTFIKKPFFVPESMRIDDLLQALQRKRTHMAVVTDEYGVTSGVVTIEDVLEEIVGEIRDELDVEFPKIRKLDKNSYEVDGSTHIDEVNEEIDLGIETDEVDTIGGYFVLMIGKIPQAGDMIEVGGYILKIRGVSKNRITILNIEKNNKRV